MTTFLAICIFLILQQTICQAFLEKIYDYIIVGAGPSGLQMAYYLQKTGRDYVVLERENITGKHYHHIEELFRDIFCNRNFCLVYQVSLGPLGFLLWLLYEKCILSK